MNITTITLKVTITGDDHNPYLVAGERVVDLAQDLTERYPDIHVERTTAYTEVTE